MHLRSKKLILIGQPWSRNRRSNTSYIVRGANALNRQLDRGTIERHLSLIRNYSPRLLSMLLLHIVRSRSLSITRVKREYRRKCLSLGGILLPGTRSPESSVRIRNSLSKTLVIMTTHRGICVATGKMVADNVTHLAGGSYTTVFQPLYRSAACCSAPPRGGISGCRAPGHRIHTFSA